MYVCIEETDWSHGYVCTEETDWSHGYVPVGRCLLVSISMAPGSASGALLFCWMERKRGGEGRERGEGEGGGVTVCHKAITWTCYLVCKHTHRESNLSFSGISNSHRVPGNVIRSQEQHE